MDALGALPDAVGGVDLGGMLIGAASLDSATREQLSFCGRYLPNRHRRLLATRAGMLIVDAPVLERMPPHALSAIVVRSDAARLDFIRILCRFFAPPRPEPGVHTSAVVAPSAQIGENVTIGPHCTVASDVVIGAGSMLHAGVHLYPRVRIGPRVTIHGGTVIGADGYGYERNTAGEMERFPHLGGVVIEHDVDIGPNVTIARGTLEDTRIGARVRIDSLVQISHNVHIQADAAIISHAILCGGSLIGERALIGPSVTVRERVSVGPDAVASAASVVTRSVREGVTVSGSPARELPQLAARH